LRIYVSFVVMSLIAGGLVTHYVFALSSRED